MRELWPCQGFPAKVWHVPAVLPHAGTRGSSSGRDQSLLVAPRQGCIQGVNEHDNGRSSRGYSHADSKRCFGRPSQHRDAAIAEDRITSRQQRAESTGAAGHVEPAILARFVDAGSRRLDPGQQGAEDPPFPPLRPPSRSHHKSLIAIVFRVSRRADVGRFSRLRRRCHGRSGYRSPGSCRFGGSCPLVKVTIGVARTLARIARRLQVRSRGRLRDTLVVSILIIMTILAVLDVCKSWLGARG